MMLTVDDLARDLKVRNEDLLRELVTLGYKVEGPESSLETDDPAALRAQLVTVLPQREVVEKRIKPTVIRRRVKPQQIEVKAEVVEIPLPPPEPEAKPEPAVPRKKEQPAPSRGPAKAREVAKKATKKVAVVERAKIIEKAPPPVKKVEDRVEVKEPVQAIPVKDKGEVTEAVPIGVAPKEAPPETAEIAEAREVEAPEAPDEAKIAEEKIARRRKKKEKKIQPAQIIGKVELKKEAPVKPEPPLQIVPLKREAERPAPVHEAAAAPLAPASAAEEELRRRSKRDKKKRDSVEERVEDDIVKVRRRKEVLLRADLYDERPRYGKLRAKGKKARPRSTEITVPKAAKRRIKLPPMVNVADLAHKMSIKASEVIRQLLSLGVPATLNESIDFETATIVGSEFGYEVESAEHSEKDLLPVVVKDLEQDLQPRPPVITVMGHVDHGKTSLLDYIRSTHVTDQEAGGITQHIGAYKVTVDRGEIVFLDTPGHEAFTAMRARGAQVTDFVVLVVAADDGVKEQTREAINHARAADVPIVVAINKIDRPEADRDRVLRELSEYGLIPEAWGGDTLFTYVSAKSGEGISEFLDTILLQAEIMELKANPNKIASGIIIEARLDKGKGPVATVLVRDGTVKLGDPFVAGVHHGKVRAMLDHEGRSVTTAGPATPVEVHGFSGVPEAGEPFIVVDEERIARQIGLQRQQKQRQKEAAPAGPVSLEDLLARMRQEEEGKELNIIVKADVQGSVEALQEAIQHLSTDEVKVNVMHSGVGTITESDVMLAGASDALIIGFNVRPGPKTTQLAEEKKVDVRLYSVIYEALEDIQKATVSMLAPVQKETVVGRAEVRETFQISKVGTIAGCYVSWGKIQRSNSVRLIRDSVPIYEGKIISMKRFKDDIREAAEGYECGIALENYRDIKNGDIIEAFTIELEPARLPS